MKVKVKNRSNSVVVYNVMLDNGFTVRRELVPNETREIEKDELERLSYQPGGKELMRDYLMIMDQEAVSDLINKVEPEYWLDEANIRKVMLEGTLDEFLDCLDFAPDGVIDIIKQLAISLPLNDVQKRAAIKTKTGFDVDRAIRALAEEKAAMAEEAAKKNDGTPAASTQTETIAAPTGRRAVPKYNIVATKTEGK